MGNDRDLVPTENLPATQADTPMGILAKMASDGADPAGLAILSDLAKEWEDRNARKEFAVALHDFQNNCPPIVKTKWGGRVTEAGSPSPYPYAALDVIEQTIRPYLHDLGFSYSWTGAVEGGIMTQICTLRHVNGHSEEGSFSCPCDSKSPSMSEQHKYAGADTLCRRYSLTAALGITMADEDTGTLDPTTVNDEQARVLEQMCVETKTDEKRFLKLARADSFETVLASKYANGVRFLEKQRSKL